VANPTEPPVKPFAAQQTFATWLDKNHAKSDGLWIKIAKKDSGIRSVTYAEALEVALCYGWIDGQRNRLDGAYFLQRFTPRLPQYVVGDQLCQGDRVDRRRSYASGGDAGGRAGQGRRPLGRRPRVAGDRGDTARARTPAPQECEGRKFFESLDSRNRYAVLHRHRDREEAGDASARPNSSSRC
jgi:hypothetical protein